MNILYHHRTQATGAEGVHIAYIIKSLRRLGHQVDVVSPTNADPTQTAGNNPYADKKGMRARFLSSVSHRLPQLLFELLELLYNLIAYFRLRRVLRPGQVSLLYERYAFFMWMGAYCAKASGVFYIVEVNEVAGEARVRKQSLVWLARAIEAYVFARADAIIVVSDFLCAKIESMGIDGARIHVVPNAVDETLFDPVRADLEVRRQFHLGDQTVVIGFIGWFVAWHNLEGLIEVFADLVKESDVRLLLVGDGVLKGAMQTLIRDRGVQDKVILPGAATYAQVPSYIQAMDICVIPGSNEYRSPIKLFEYMAMKRATVAPRLQPIQQVLQDGENGVMFDQGDPQSLRAALEDLVRRPEKRASLGEKARQTILARHTWLQNAQRVVDLTRR